MGAHVAKLTQRAVGVGIASARIIIIAGRVVILNVVVSGGIISGSRVVIRGISRVVPSGVEAASGGENVADETGRAINVRVARSAGRRIVIARALIEAMAVAAHLAGRAIGACRTQLRRDGFIAASRGENRRKKNDEVNQISHFHGHTRI
jgi:hypothetical protein